MLSHNHYHPIVSYLELAMFDYPIDMKYIDRTERRVEVITPQLQWMHLSQAVQEAYNDFNRGLNEDSHQVNLFYYKFKEYEIQPGQPDRTPPCRSRRELKVQTKLLL